jgi:hypothetical protein
MTMAQRIPELEPVSEPRESSVSASAAQSSILSPLIRSSHRGPPSGVAFFSPRLISHHPNAALEDVGQPPPSSLGPAFYEQAVTNPRCVSNMWV